MVIIGLLFIVISIISILFLRNKIKKGDNSFLKTLLKISDTLVWIRFIGGIILVLFLFFFLTIFSKKH